MNRIAFLKFIKIIVFIRVVCIEREKTKLRSFSDEEQLLCPKCGERMRILVDKVKHFTEKKY